MYQSLGHEMLQFQFLLKYTLKNISLLVPERDFNLKLWLKTNNSLQEITNHLQTKNKRDSKDLSRNIASTKTKSNERDFAQTTPSCFSH